MRRLLLIALLVVLSNFGQGQTTGAGFIIYVGSAPSGTCSAGAYQENVIGLGTVYTCQSGTWTQVGSGAGTVTSIGTTSPITGGTITGTGTIACATCVKATSPGAGIAHFAGSTQEVTSSAINLANGDVTGNLPVTNLNSGTSASSSTFWRGDGTWAAASGPTVESHTANATATHLDFTTCLVGANNARIDISNLILATDSADLNFLVSTNGGSSYDNTAGHYAQADGYNTGGNGAQGGAASQALINLTDTASNGVKAIANTGYSGSFTLFGPGGSVFKELAGVATYKRGFDSNAMTLHLGALYLQTTAVNAFQVITSSGNLTSGTVYCTPLD